jgi:hypothetical protein
MTCNGTVCDACSDVKGGFGFGLCSDCYLQGTACPASEEHCLLIFLSAKVAKLDEPSPYKSGRARCNHCSKTVDQGPYYRTCFHNPRHNHPLYRKQQERLARPNKKTDCSDPKCLTGNGSVDMCLSCYDRGKACFDTAHRLSMHFAYGFSKDDSHSKACNICRNGIEDGLCYRKPHAYVSIASEESAEKDGPRLFAMQQR